MDNYTDKLSYFKKDTIILFSTKKQKCLILTDINDQYNVNKRTINLIFTYNGDNTYNIILPDNIICGLYFINNDIPIIIKEYEDNKTDIDIIIPTNTMRAYNLCGGKNFYGDMKSDYKNRAQKLSFLDKFVYKNVKYTFRYELGFLKWIMDKNNISQNYISDIDLDNYNSLRSNNIIIIGHSEYWSITARDNLEKAIKNNKNIMFLTGNTMWWQIKYSDNYNNIICHKDKNIDDTINWPDIQYIPIEYTTGLTFKKGGYGTESGYRNLFKDVTCIEWNTDNEIIKLSELNEVNTYFEHHEADGWDYIEKNGKKYYKNIYDFNYVNILGSSPVYRSKFKTHMVILFRRKPNEGFIFNAGSTNWCTDSSFKQQSIVHITETILNIFLKRMTFNENSNETLNIKNLFDNKFDFELSEQNISGKNKTLGNEIYYYNNIIRYVIGQNSGCTGVYITNINIPNNSTKVFIVINGKTIPDYIPLSYCITDEKSDIIENDNIYFHENNCNIYSDKLLPHSSITLSTSYPKIGYEIIINSIMIYY
jgi:hypothetical protein